MPKTNHLDTKAVIGHNLMIKYHSDRPPSEATKKFLRKSVDIAGSAMLSTVWAIDKIVLFRRDEPKLITDIMDKHFCLNRSPTLSSAKNAKSKLTNETARRTYLGAVRKVMLSTSFHLNTGVYLLDVDAGHRTVVGDWDIDLLDPLWKQPAPASSTKTHVVSKNIEGYVSQRAGKFSGTGGKSSGAIHVSFDLAKTYSPEEMARIIIHEATHTYCRTVDIKYAWDPAYDLQDPTAMQTNADSFAFAAMSICAKSVLDSPGLKGFTYS